MKRTKLLDVDREVIAGLRESLCERGHFRGEANARDREGRVCLVLNPVWDSPVAHGATYAHGLSSRVDYMERIFAAITEVAGVEWRGNHQDIYDRAVKVNDTLPTEELVDILAALEVG